MKAGRSILSQSKLRAGLIRMTTAHNKNHSEQIKAMVAGGGNGQSAPALTDDAGKALLGTLLTELTKQTGGVVLEDIRDRMPNEPIAFG